jgi:peptidoglycan/xylan/chitin deacetylase (PgdA/CDA1 family)
MHRLRLIGMASVDNLRKKVGIMTLRLIKFLISVFFYLVDFVGKSLHHLLGRKTKKTCVVLYYHAVPVGHRKRFARQMDAIIRWALPISVDNLGKSGDSGHYVAVTFDDGYQSVIENALPELAHRRIPLMIFVPTDRLGKRPTWLTDPADSLSKEVVMSVDQLKTLDFNLVSLGSHGVTHSNLLLLAEADAKKEIYQSKQFLENLLCTHIDALSFPYGAFNHTHVEIARQAGYKRVFSILPTLAASEYVTGRVSVDPTDWIMEFRLKIRGSYRWLPKAFSLKRKFFQFLGKNS